MTNLPCKGIYVAVGISAADSYWRKSSNCAWPSSFKRQQQKYGICSSQLHTPWL